jgi:predicted RNA-binding Zn-ribbon protein involved in translation (DUF1610 family)
MANSTQCYTRPIPRQVLPMTENLLYLYPEDTNTVPADMTTMLDGLRREGFIGDEINFNGENHYHPGDEFISLITFLGCSPVIATEVTDSSGEGFSHISIEGPLDTPSFVAGDNLKIPRCPACGQRFENWQALVEAWRHHPEDHTFPCPECGKALTAPQLRWRKCAGFGRFFIKVWGIFESEAVPSPELIALLEKLGGCRWQHFYVRYQD